MKKRIISFMLASVMALSSVAFTYAANIIPAFPGAEGGGIYTSGGRGCEVYVVTTLDDYDPSVEQPIAGSFRDAVSQSNRTIVFNVSGVINLKAPLTITDKKNMTIAGQSAPGDGITLYGYSTNISRSENIIIRYIRFRPGAENVHVGDSMDALWGRSMKNIMIDHISTSWSTDETLSVYRAENMTVQWSIISESLTMSGHTKGRHGYGGIWGGVNTTYHHNLIANHTSRTPRLGGGTPEADDNEHIANFDVRNNVIYNWGFNTCYGGGRANANFINNYAKAGNGTREDVAARIIDCGEENKPGAFYVSGNVIEGNKEVSEDNSKGIYISEDNAPFTTISEKEFEMEGTKHLKTDEPKAAYNKVLAYAGAVYPKRDAVDARIINQVKNNTGTFANLDEQVGGLPYTQEIRRPVYFDNDLDGIADKWELEHGLDPTDKTDSKLPYIDGNGYTYIEVYLNSLVDMQYAPENPEISLSVPNNSIYYIGNPIEIEAEVSENTKKVEFYNGSEIIATVTEKPFKTTLNDLPDGTYYISAKATAYNGLQTQSDASAIHINTKTNMNWNNRDIGSPAVKGNSYEENGVYTVKGSGKLQADSDTCQFMYKTLIGDGEITAKVDSVTAVDNHAFAGLMVRDGLSGDDKTVALGLSHTKPYEWSEVDPKTNKSTKYYRNAFGVYMCGRSEKGGEFDQLAENLDSLEKAEGTGVTLKNDIPFKDYDKFLGYYLKLRREGDTFISYTSSDGVEWEELSRRTVKMGEKVYMGIAVDGNKVANNIDNLNTAEFSEVSFVGSTTKAEKITYQEANK